MTYDPPTPPCYKDPVIASRTRGACRECRHFSPCLNAIEDFDRDLHRAMMEEPAEGEGLDYDVGAKFAEVVRRHLPPPVISSSPAAEPAKAGARAAAKPSSRPAAKVPPVSAAPASPPAESAEPAPYAFPEVARVDGELAELESQLGTLCDDARIGEMTAEDEEAFRHRFCSISIRMNELKVIPPKFRARLSTPPVGRTRFDNLHTNDLTVVDLHWLWCQDPEHFVEPGKPNPFGEDFDWREASRFASLKLHAESKAHVLALDLYDQWQLAVLQSGEVRTLFNRWREQSARLRHAIKAHSRRDHRLRDARILQDWPLLLVAEAIAAHAKGQLDGGANLGAKTDVRPSDVAPIFRWITGRPIERRILGTRLARAREFVRSLPKVPRTARRTTGETVERTEEHTDIGLSLSRLSEVARGWRG